MSEQQHETGDQIGIGSHVDAEVACAQCERKGKASAFFTFQGDDKKDVHLCPDCRQSVNADLERETKDPSMAGAIGLGVLAALVGGVLWYFITIATKTEFGYIAIGLGYIVGMGVYIGSGKKRGQTLQFISLALTILAIFIAEHYILEHFANQYIQANLGEFPDMAAGDRISLYWFNADVLKDMISPIGLLIYAIAIYVAYGVPKARKL